jgi:hypothetical protein
VGSWGAFYQSDLQSVWALLPVPALFLVYAAARGRARAAASQRTDARTVLVYSVVFALEALLDPLANGPLARALSLSPAARTAVMLAFVLLGDFRVFALVFLLARERRRALLRAALCTIVVPALAGGFHFGLARRLLPGAPEQALWLVYELLFTGVALGLRGRVVPFLTRAEPEGHRCFLRGALLYVAAYYGLWAASDLLILSGVDAGWALRLLPNQLYYAFWVPFVFLRFTAAR